MTVASMKARGEMHEGEKNVMKIQRRARAEPKSSISCFDLGRNLAPVARENARAVSRRLITGAMV